MKRKTVATLLLCAGLSFSTAYANSCKDELFSVTIKKELSIADAIDNIAETCGLSVVVKDPAAQNKMKQKLYYVKLKKTNLKNFLNVVLKDNDLSYKLVGNKLIISYLITKTFKVHYIASDRVGSSSANINIANAGKSKGKGTTATSGMTINSNDKFSFWSKMKEEIHRILVTAGDGTMHFKKVKDGWADNAGNIWQYNPTEPIVDPEAGLITVTGTPQQIRRVAKYISSMAKQVKTQVLIDVKILSVTLNKDKQTGIDWSQLYGLENFSINSYAMSQKNMSEWKSNSKEGINEAKFGIHTRPSNAKVFETFGHATINDVIKYLKTQGTVKTISNPKVMTLNNQPALISVGKEIFYKTTSTITTTGASNDKTTSESIDSVFAGILLDITPEIDERGTITLKINPSITETDGPVGQSGTRTMPPDLVRRQISTVIKVKNGKHAILGGLISTAESSVESGVPLISKIPLIGEAFKRSRKIKRTEELVVIITPRIVGKSNLSLKSLGYRSIVK